MTLEEWGTRPKEFGTGEEASERTIEGAGEEVRLRVCGGVDTGGGWEEGRKPEKGLVEDSEGKETGGDTADAGGERNSRHRLGLRYRYYWGVGR